MPRRRGSFRELKERERKSWERKKYLRNISASAFVVLLVSLNESFCIVSIVQLFVMIRISR